MFSSFFASSDEIDASLVKTGSNTYFSFNCFFCNDSFPKKPNDLTRGRNGRLLDYHFCCGNELCEKKQSFCKIAQKFEDSSKPSFAEQHPELAKQFLCWVEDKKYNLLTLDDISEASQLRAYWQCPKRSYHKPNATLANKNYGDTCSFCANNACHILDSFYYELENRIELNNLHPEDHALAKTIKRNSPKKIRIKCKYCCEYGKPKNPYQYLTSDGCILCRDEPDKRRLALLKKQGSVANHPTLSKIYAYDQPNLPEKYKNPLPPEEIPAEWHGSVFWLCKYGHPTRAPVRERLKGVSCRYCSPSSSSRIECIIYKELEYHFPNILFTHQSKNDSYIIDISGKLNGVEIAIEYDGKKWHKGKEKLDSDRDKHLKNRKIETVRIREEGLKTLDTSTCFIFPSKNEDKQFLVLKSVLEFIAVFFDLPAKINNCFTQTESALLYYAELQNVPYEKSAAYLHPHLVKEVDTHKTRLTLAMFTPGSDVKMPWKCSVCGYEWPTAISHRTNSKKPTGCPRCTGQVTLPEDSFATHYPELGRYVIDGYRAAVNGTKKTVLCCYPHKTVKGNWDNSAKHICGATSVRDLGNVAAQYNRQGHIWDGECKHEGHSKKKETQYKKSGAAISETLKKKKLTLINKVLGKDAFDILPTVVRDCILSAEQTGIKCPLCNERTMAGKPLEAQLKFIKNNNEFLCTRCLNGGRPINPSFAFSLQQIALIKEAIDQLKTKGFSIDITLNKFGVQRCKKGLSIVTIQADGAVTHFKLHRYKLSI